MKLSQMNTDRIYRKALAVILLGVFLSFDFAQDKILSLPKDLFTNTLSWAQEERFFSTGMEKKAFFSGPVTQNNKLAPPSRLNSEDFKHSLTVGAICKHVERDGNLDDKSYLNDVLARLDAEKNSNITVLPYEIIIEIPNEGLSIRYFDPTKSNVITPYSDTSRLETKVIGPRLNRQVIHRIKALLLPAKDIAPAHNGVILAQKLAKIGDVLGIKLEQPRAEETRLVEEFFEADKMGHQLSLEEFLKFIRLLSSDSYLGKKTMIQIFEIDLYGGLKMVRDLKWKLHESEYVNELNKIGNSLGWGAWRKLAVKDVRRFTEQFYSAYIAYWLSEIFKNPLQEHIPEYMSLDDVKKLLVENRNVKKEVIRNLADKAKQKVHHGIAREKLEVRYDNTAELTKYLISVLVAMASDDRMFDEVESEIGYLIMHIIGNAIIDTIGFYTGSADSGFKFHKDYILESDNTKMFLTISHEIGHNILGFILSDEIANKIINNEADKNAIHELFAELTMMACAQSQGVSSLSELRKYVEDFFAMDLKARKIGFENDERYIRARKFLTSLIKSIETRQSQERMEGKIDWIDIWRKTISFIQAETKKAEHKKLTFDKFAQEIHNIAIPPIIPFVQNQTSYLEKNRTLFKDILGENKPDTLVRVPVEAIESIGIDNIKDFLATFQEAPNGYVELYYMSGVVEVSESVYQKYGLQKKPLPKDFKRTRESTVTLFPAFKGEEINQSTIVSRLGAFDVRPDNTILSPIGLQHDPAGLIRATILGLKMMDIARQIKEKGIDITKDQAFKDKIQLEILEQLKNVCDADDLKNFNLTPDDIIALATGTINNIITALKKLIKLLPITPIDADGLRQIYEHAKEVITAA